MFIAQKWSKGKQKEKVNNMVLFDQGTYDKLLSEAPKFKLITPSILSDRLRVWLAQSHLACIFTCYKCMSFDCEIWTMFLNFCLKFVCLALLYPSNPSLKMEWKRNGGGWYRSSFLSLLLWTPLYDNHMIWNLCQRLHIL